MAKVIKYCLVIGAILLLQDIIIKRCGFCQISITSPIIYLETYCENIFEGLGNFFFFWFFLLSVLFGFFALKLQLELSKLSILKKKRISDFL